jgi:undecaprenyl-diphosphatase
MIDKLIQLDYDLFFLVNRDAGNEFFDLIMPWLREARIWIPLYLLFAYLVIKLKGKKSWLWILAIAMSVGLADFIASGVFKPGFERLRPCHNQALNQDVILRKKSGCGGKYGFISSHAANHFALALFLSLLLTGGLRKPLSWFLFFWASSIAFAQVYVGVHYPADVAVGMLIGLLSACLFYRISLIVENKLYP